MAAYTREDGYIVQTHIVEGTQAEVSLRAKNVRRERTGVHATVIMKHGGIILAWDNMNVERHSQRITLARAAHSNLPPLDKKAFPEAHLKHALDLFCGGLWHQHVRDMAGEVMEGDPNIGPPKSLVGPYLLEGGGTFCFAPPGAGKSYTLLAMAVSLDAGCSKMWPVHEPRRAMFVNLERSRDSLRYRLARVNAALGLDSRRPLLFQNARGRSLFDIADGIAETIQQHEVEALFVDSISRAGAGDLKEPTVGNRVVDTLNGLCPTWVALTHTPRADPSHVYGTVMFTAGADVEVRLTAQSNTKVTGVRLEVTKVNDLPKPPLAVHALLWGPDGLEDMRPARRHEFPEIEAGKATTLGDEVGDCLKMVGLGSATDVARALGRNRSAVSSLLSTDGRFVAVRKEGRTPLYGLRAGEDDK